MKQQNITKIISNQSTNDSNDISTTDQTKVRVAVRIRPFLGNELLSNPYEYLSYPSYNQISIGKDHIFTYDHVFPMDTSQEDLYNNAIHPLIPSLVDGYNVTIIAYGQTGSGKTYTIGTSGFNKLNTRYSLDCIQKGINSDAGCIPRFLQTVFEYFNEEKENRTAIITASFLEIYGDDNGDNVYDLLCNPLASNMKFKSPNKARDKLSIRENNGKVYVQGLKEVVVKNCDEAMEQLRIGSLHRVTASTGMNDVSSRSHAVFTITITQEIISKDSNEMKDDDISNNDIQVKSIISKLTFVDLAGSERLKRTLNEGVRKKEAININVGLLALGNVINALGSDENLTEKKYVPYRSSKITRLLQDALGGNSRTIFLACISPTEESAGETLNTLKYANRARNIKNKAVKNIDPKVEEIANLRSYISILKRELVRYKFANTKFDNENPASPTEVYDVNDKEIMDLLTKEHVKDYFSNLRSKAKETRFNEEDPISVSSIKISRHSLGSASIGNNSISPSRDSNHPKDIHNLESNRVIKLPVDDKLNRKKTEHAIVLLDEILRHIKEEEDFANEERKASLEIEKLSYQITQKTAKCEALKKKLDALTSSLREITCNSVHYSVTTTEYNYIGKLPGKVDILMKKENERLKTLTDEIQELVTKRENVMENVRKASNAHIDKAKKNLMDIEILKQSPIENITKSFNTIEMIRKSLSISNAETLQLINRIVDGSNQMEKNFMSVLQKQNGFIMARRFSRNRLDKEESTFLINTSKNFIKQIDIDLHIEALQADLLRESRRRGDMLFELTEMDKVENDINKTSGILDTENEIIHVKLNICEENIQRISLQIQALEESRNKNTIKDLQLTVDEYKQIIEYLLEELSSVKRIELCAIERNLDMEWHLQNNGQMLDTNGLSQTMRNIKDMYDIELETLKQQYEDEIIDILKLDDITSSTADSMVVLQQTDLTMAPVTIKNVLKRFERAEDKISELEEICMDQQEKLIASEEHNIRLNNELKALRATIQQNETRLKSYSSIERCNSLWIDLGLNSMKELEDMSGTIQVMDNIIHKKLESLQEKHAEMQNEVKTLKDALCGFTAIMMRMGLITSNDMSNNIIVRQPKETLHSMKQRIVKELESLKSVLYEKMDEKKTVLENIFSILDEIGVVTTKDIKQQLDEVATVLNMTCKLNEQISPSNSNIFVHRAIALKEIRCLLQVIKETDCSIEDIEQSMSIDMINLSTDTFQQDKMLLEFLLDLQVKRLQFIEKNSSICHKKLNHLEICQTELLKSCQNMISQLNVKKFSDEDINNIITYCSNSQMFTMRLSIISIELLSIFTELINDIYVKRIDTATVLKKTLIECSRVPKQCASAVDTKITSLCGPDLFIYLLQEIDKLIEERVEKNNSLIDQIKYTISQIGLKSEEEKRSFVLHGLDEVANALKNASYRNQIVDFLVNNKQMIDAMLKNYWINDMSLDIMETLPERLLCPNENFVSLLCIYDPLAKHEIWKCNIYNKIHLILAYRDAEFYLLTNLKNITNERSNKLEKIGSFLNQIRLYNSRLAEFEMNASDSNRLLDRTNGSGKRLLEEERFRKTAAKRYPILICNLRNEIKIWKEKEGEEFDFSMFGEDLLNILDSSMDTKTELMHLNLSIVDSNKKSK